MRTGPVVVLAVGLADADADRLATDLEQVGRGALAVRAVADATEGIQAAQRVRVDDGVIPVAFVGADDLGTRGAATAVALHQATELEGTRIVLVTSRASLRGMDEALQAGAVHGMITRPWTLHGLTPMFETQLATYLVEHSPERLGDFAEVFDDDDLRAAAERAERQHRTVGARPEVPHPLLDPTVDIEVLERRLVDLLDQTLAHPPRIRVAPGTVLIEQDEDVGGIYVLLDGVVRLSSTTTTGERVVHEKSTGPILGLLSLSGHARAMHRCQAVTDVRAIPITVDQLARALADEPELSGLLLLVLITALSGRLRRSDELQLELDQSLSALSAARSQLVGAARFTAVGEMAAGMAHELNNPAAALARAADHLVDDLRDVVGDAAVMDVLERQAAASSTTTAEYRTRRRALTDALGDRALADRMLDLGVSDPEEARALARLGDAELGRREAAARLGRTVRGIVGAAGNVVRLVGSLKSYLRGDDAQGPLVPDVDVATGVEDALRLVSQRLENVRVVRELDAVPTVVARPGALQQVWTNLITNALDAMGDQGELAVSVASAGPNWVRVRVIDDGPGVPTDELDRLFEPRFTHDHGRVRYGMGLGLSISRRIVDEHGGTITVDRRDDHTVFTVDLPVGGPS